jgi:hypothetical protein
MLLDIRAAVIFARAPSPWGVGVVGRAGRADTPTPADNEDRKFAKKCLALQQYVESELGVQLIPREIDNLLLYVHAEKKPSIAVKRDAPKAARLLP